MSVSRLMFLLVHCDCGIVISDCVFDSDLICALFAGKVEDVFLNRMGLTWTDAVALLGGHTIGRGSEHFSVSVLPRSASTTYSQLLVYTKLLPLRTM